MLSSDGSVDQRWFIEDPIVQGNAIYIDIPEPLKKINRSFELEIEDILLKSVTGKWLRNGKTLEFVLDIGPANWKTSNMVMTVVRGKETELFEEAEIKNKSSKEVSFKLMKNTLSDYIIPNVKRSAIPSGGVFPITFTVPKNTYIPVGEIDGEIVVEFTQDELVYEKVLKIKILSKSIEPLWVRSENAAQNGKKYIIAQFSTHSNSDTPLSEDVRDKVSAYIGDQCVGVSQIMWDEEVERYLAYIEVYNVRDNTCMGCDSISFKMWDASENMVYTAKEKIFYQEDVVQFGKRSAPVILHTLGVEQLILLEPGVNFVSFNIIPSSLDVGEVMKDIKQEGASIKQKLSNFSAYKKDTDEWEGGLKSIDVKQGYKIYVPAPDVLKLSGIPNYENEELSLDEYTGGNSWVAAHLKASKKIENTISATETRSLIISDGRGNFAVKNEERNGNYGGGLRYIEPGKGYEVTSPCSSYNDSIDDEDIRAYFATVPVDKGSLYEEKARDEIGETVLALSLDDGSRHVGLNINLEATGQQEQFRFFKTKLENKLDEECRYSYSLDKDPLRPLGVLPIGALKNVVLDIQGSKELSFEFECEEPAKMLVLQEELVHNEGFEGGRTSYWETALDGSTISWFLRSGSTPSSKTGPRGAQMGTHYAYIESSRPNGSRTEERTFNLETRYNVPYSADEIIVDFWYHMYGSGMGKLILEVGTIFDPSHPIMSPVWEMSGAKGSSWKKAVVSIPAQSLAGKEVIIRLKGVTKANYIHWRGDMAVDNITLKVSKWVSAPGTYQGYIALRENLFTKENCFSSEKLPEYSAFNSLSGETEQLTKRPVKQFSTKDITMILKPYIYGTIVDTAKYRLQLLNNGRIIEEDALDVYMSEDKYFIRLYGNSSTDNDTIGFQLLDKTTGKVYEDDIGILFTKDDTKGTPSNPFPLYFGEMEKENQLLIWPNPSQVGEEMSLYFDGMEHGYSLEVYGVHGRKIKEVDDIRGTYKLKIENAGVYILRVVTKDNIFLTQKILVN